MSIFINNPTHQLYGFPNILSTLHPFVDPFIGSSVSKIQLYNQLGLLYPSILAKLNGINPKAHENIKIFNFNNTINVGIFGLNNDVKEVKTILDTHFKSNPIASASASASPIKASSVVVQTPLDDIYPNFIYPDTQTQIQNHPQLLYGFTNLSLLDPYLTSRRASYFDTPSEHKSHRRHRDKSVKSGGSKHSRHRYRSSNMTDSMYDPVSPYNMINSLPVSEVQFYNPLTGLLGPSITSSNSVNSGLEGLIKRHFPSLNNQNIIIINYDNTKINVGIFGSENDVYLVKQILEAHFNPAPAAAPAPAPVAPAAVVPVPVPAAVTAAATTLIDSIKPLADPTTAAGAAGAAATAATAFATATAGTPAIAAAATNLATALNNIPYNDASVQTALTALITAIGTTYPALAAAALAPAP